MLDDLKIVAAYGNLGITVKGSGTGQILKVSHLFIHTVK